MDPNKKTPSTATDFAEREAALAAREAKLAADEEVARTRQLEEKRTATVAFADGLVKGGSILPRQKTAIVEVLMNLSQEPLSFSEGETTISQSPEALLREILSTKPAVVNFSEKTGTADDPVDFADA
ncbi:hypothetical protein ACKQC9_31465, partial [Klebsiella michiganensis]|uniref:hypothetical protein n=1 Tax=Klebsiella michiganensis TaxID=1134687 RepID=UPI003D6F330D